MPVSVEQRPHALREVRLCLFDVVPCGHAPNVRTDDRQPLLGAPLDETLEMLQRACDEQRLAEPVTRRHQEAEIAPPAG